LAPGSPGDGSARQSPRGGRDTTNGADRAPPSADRRRAPSAENQLTIEQERRERSDEDRRYQRPPGRTVKERPRQHPGENLVEDETGGLHEQELDLHPVVLALAVAAEAPAAVEDETDRDCNEEGDDHR